MKKRVYTLYRVSTIGHRADHQYFLHSNNLQVIFINHNILSRFYFYAYRNIFKTTTSISI